MRLNKQIKEKSLVDLENGIETENVKEIRID